MENKRHDAPFCKHKCSTLCYGYFSYHLDFVQMESAIKNNSVQTFEALGAQRKDRNRQKLTTEQMLTGEVLLNGYRSCA